VQNPQNQENSWQNSHFFAVLILTADTISPKSICVRKIAVIGQDSQNSNEN
jgi:hypothetical protein